MTPAREGAARLAWRNRHLVAGMALIAAVVLVVAGSIAGSYFLALHVSAGTARQVATGIEQARTIAAAKAQSAEIASALRECTALQGLADIKGSHVASATYGYHLQVGIANVYRSSGCPALLKQYGPRP